ncbi:hypothetical protein [Streptomyces sp. NPDC047070]|uniref:hypothetical protein n=1 Tax=Streptomyces sp. NPDC047070 TaxID=3154923 RepID=UPI0034573A17
MTGLASGCAQGIVCVDALVRGIDKAAVVHELGRHLAPGARLVMTRSQRTGTTPPWRNRPAPPGWN